MYCMVDSGKTYVTAPFGFHWEHQVRGRNANPIRARRRLVRQGAVTLEFILVMPIIVVITWAVFQYGILLLVRQSVTHAATVAAREAGKGEPIDVLGRVVDNVLVVHCLDIADDDGDPIPNSGMQVVLETGDPNGGAALVQSFGDGSLDCDPPDDPEVQPDEVRVTVCVDLTKPPICNFLFNFGLTELTFQGKRLEISSLVKKE